MSGCRRWLGGPGLRYAPATPSRKGKKKDRAVVHNIVVHDWCCTW